MQRRAVTLTTRYQPRMMRIDHEDTLHFAIVTEPLKISETKRHICRELALG
jgi:hypothetical protein